MGKITSVLAHRLLSSSRDNLKPLDNHPRTPCNPSWQYLHLFRRLVKFFFSLDFAKLSKAKPQHQLSWLALASLNFT